MDQAEINFFYGMICVDLGINYMFLFLKLLQAWDLCLQISSFGFSFFQDFVTELLCSLMRSEREGRNKEKREREERERNIILI